MNTSTRHRVFFTLAALLAVIIIAPARAAIVGQLDGGTPSSGLSGDFKRGSRVTLTEPGILSVLDARLDGFGGPQSGLQRITMSVYTDVNGVPGVKLAESVRLQVPAQMQPQTYKFFMDPTPLPAGTYWLVLHTEGASSVSTPGIIRDYGTTPGGSNWYGSSDLFSDGASSPFGTGNTGTAQLVVAAEYLSAAQAKFAGRATVAATASGGLTSNAKRGSRFTMSETGRVYELTAYLDGKGGAAGSQKLRYALYHDSGGLPSTLVTESDEVTVTAGQAGKWVSSHLVPVDLTSGNYWIVIHTGDTGGVARDYGDGAANWYSNADAYADGASATFGSGNSGSVTISAAVLYSPGASQTRTVGRTTIAATPSGGLTANFLRGSSVSATSVPDGATLTGFWAYLDGNGGASGNQQLRAALYGIAPAPIPYDKIAESDTVTIAAGLSPRWVHFPLTRPVELGGTFAYLIALQSGDKGGVARDYGDGDANWIGAPDAFADGALDDISPGGPDKTPGFVDGTVTLSIYAEYTVPANSP